MNNIGVLGTAMQAAAVEDGCGNDPTRAGARSRHSSTLENLAVTFFRSLYMDGLQKGQARGASTYLRTRRV